MLNHPLTLVDVNLRATDQGNVFDFSFECEIPGVLNVVFTVVDDEELVDVFASNITATHDGESPMVHIVNAVLDKPELRPDASPSN